MAATTTYFETTHKAPIWERFWTWMFTNHPMQRRLDSIERLNNLSDLELAKMGLNRDQIYSHVFNDRFFY